MKRTCGRSEALLNVVTVLALFVATGVVIRDRILPAIEERRIVEPGEPIPDGLQLLDLSTGDTVELAALAPVTSLALLTSCPSCERSAPVWRQALAAPGSDANRFVAIAIREVAGTREWLRRELPDTRAFRPLDADRFLSLLRIEVVPTVLTIGDDGRLERRREGVILPGEAAELLREGPDRARGTAE
jgi:hypothetical protein